jgi:hypothetical protein
MPRDLDLTFDISTGALTLDRVVGNYVKRSETLTLSVTIVSNGASATIPAGLVGTLKPVNTYGTTLAQWTTFSQVGATNVYTAATTINAAAVTTLLGTTTEQTNCVFDFAGAGVVESDTLALVLKNNVTRDDDTAPTALLNRNDFLVTNGTGLLVNVAAGYAANGAFVAAQASLAITNATNYIEVTAAGVASVNTTAFTAGSYPLATVVASAGAITSNTDLRAWITPKPGASGGVTSITGTANEITVTGTTTPTLSLPNALTFTGKTVTGGTFTGGAFNGTVGATTPSTIAGTTGTFSDAVSTSGSSATISTVGADAEIYTGGLYAYIYTTGANAQIYTAGANAYIFTDGSNATIYTGGLDAYIYTTGANAHIYTSGAGAYIQTRSTFKLNSGTYTTTLSHAPTANRAIALPNAAGTLALTTDITGGTLAGSFTTLTASATTSLLLGTAGSAVGTIGFRNATSGTTTLAPATGALGTGTVTLPLSGTLAISSGANTFTGVQSMTSPNITTSITTPSTTFTAFAGATTLATIGGTGATAVVAIPGTLDASNSTTGSVTMAGGLAVAKKLHLGDSFVVTKSQATSTTCEITNTSATNGAAAALHLTNNAGVGYVFTATSNTAAGFEAGKNRLAVDSGTTLGVSLTGRGAAATIEFYTAGLATANRRGIMSAAGGFSWGSATDPGAGNALFGGTLAVTGASTLTGLLTANGGITLGNAQNIAFNTTTGTKIGATTSQKLSFWNATPIVQPTTAVASATVASPGGGVNLKTDDTFDGYTIAQVVKALRNAGLLA